MEKMVATTKILLSHDYCNFEISLSGEVTDLIEANTLRKRTQQLADEAVRQYKTAKEKASLYLSDQIKKSSLKKEVDKIREKPVKQWTPEDKAKVKCLEDDEWERNLYRYEDDELPF